MQSDSKRLAPLAAVRTCGCSDRLPCHAYYLLTHPLPLVSRAPQAKIHVVCHRHAVF